MKTSEPVFTTAIRRRKDSNITALWAVLSIICVVTISVNFFVGRSPLAFLDPYMYAGAGVFAILSFVNYQRSKLKLSIYKDSREIILHIEGKRKGDIEVRSPFKINAFYAWEKPGGRGLPMKETYLKIKNMAGENVLTFHNTYGVALAGLVPPDFVQVDQFAYEVKNVFDVGKLMDVYQVLRK
jgi:hypothetical protein